MQAFYILLSQNLSLLWIGPLLIPLISLSGWGIFNYYSRRACWTTRITTNFMDLCESTSCWSLLQPLPSHHHSQWWTQQFTSFATLPFFHVDATWSTLITLIIDLSLGNFEGGWWWEDVAQHWIQWKGPNTWNRVQCVTCAKVPP